ncbi:unnamed protein product [Clonostachys rosea f. rosea IK726]|uniref:Potassium transport protein n=2 Tax=Bionectria ochroleuca TaxID=29856 RepID=A0A0B7KH05_BIOOC|nr:unnamed protein product [Clonostachys rosea f. rosea IK726]
MAIPKWLPINFLTLHYAYIIFMGLLAIPVLLPGGNLEAIDAYFFGASASTESGLNTVDVKDLQLYQQLYIYFIPMFTNLGFINSLVVLVRLIWFRKYLKKAAPQLLKRYRGVETPLQGLGHMKNISQGQDIVDEDIAAPEADKPQGQPVRDDISHTEFEEPSKPTRDASGPHITIDDSSKPIRDDVVLHIPSPRERDQGKSLTELSRHPTESDNEISVVDGTFHPNPSIHDLRKRLSSVASPRSLSRERRRSMSRESVTGVAHIAKSMLILDADSTHHRERRHSTQVRDETLGLSHFATIGRNSEFTNMTRSDWEKLGGTEYRSLQLLLKIVVGYFFGLHLFGAICIVGWIQYADPKYKEYLASTGSNMNWWAFYSAQTMVDNLGFTLTPDSMISFRDAIWPMIVFSFLAFAGNTLYPVFLRLVIWTMSKIVPRTSQMQEPLSFLLNHPRRCYTLLFPSRPTWILFGIIFALNFVDTLLIIVLDLNNPEVAALPAGQRLFAAIFQAASSRHTGTSTFNLANVNPAVQFSLMVMMYIAIFPIALSIRASNTYEEKSLGIWEQEGHLDEVHGRSYLMKHMQNQLNFDLWYIFLGIFCICIAEAGKIADTGEPAFSVWTVFFEVTSAYGNVGLSLGHPSVATSLSGKFTIFSKLVICAMMIRGRHRGLPYALDRAIMLPDQPLLDLEPEDEKTV